MPDPHKLTILTDLRRAAGVNLTQMAQWCGLTGKRSYESASAWERGLSVPHTRMRPRFLAYLCQALGLAASPARLQAVWEVLVDEWGWEPLCAEEVYASGAPPAEGDLLALPERPDGSPIIPAPALLPPGSRMPFSRNPLFVGREGELRALAATFGLEAPEPAGGRAAAVTGPDWIGKTQLACEFVYRYGQFFPGGVFWLNCAAPGGLSAEIAACGAGGQLALRPDFDGLSRDCQVQLVLEAWQSPLPRLLVFDNCDHPDLLAHWRPHIGGSHMLLTSRRMQWDRALGVYVLPLGVLSRQQSVALLRKHRPDLAPNDLSLIAIAAELGDQPLALHRAGSFLARYGGNINLPDYLSQLRAAAPAAGAALRLYPPWLQSNYGQHWAHVFVGSQERLDAADGSSRLTVRLAARAVRLAPDEPLARERPGDAHSDMQEAWRAPADLDQSQEGLMQRVVGGELRRASDLHPPP